MTGLIADAGAVEVEEPDWRERFETHCARWPKLPRYLAEDNAFEATLKDWRRHHFTWVAKNNKPAKAPAGAVEAMIALAGLKIFPPRHLIKDVPHGGEMGYQHDDHMWLSINQEQWRIVMVEDRTLCLENGFTTPPDTMQIDLSKARWAKYTAAAAAALEAHRNALAECQDSKGASDGPL